MFNPRKLSALAVMMVLLILLLTGCASAPKVPKTAAEAEIQSGITGKTVTITDEAQVKQVLEKNKSERHIRGGMATREKYLNLSGDYETKF